MMSGIRPPLPAAALARNREYVFPAHELVGEASGNRGVTRTVLWMRSMEERGALVSYGPSVHSRGAPVSIVVAAQISTRVASVVGRSGILDHLPQHLTLCYRVTLLKSLERSFCCDRDNHISRAVDGVDLSQVPFCGMWLVALRPWPLSVCSSFFRTILPSICPPCRYYVNTTGDQHSRSRTDYLFGSIAAAFGRAFVSFNACKRQLPPYQSVPYR